MILLTALSSSWIAAFVVAVVVVAGMGGHWVAQGLVRELQETFGLGISKTGSDLNSLGSVQNHQLPL